MKPKKTLYWRYAVLMPLALRRELETVTPMSPPWSDRQFEPRGADVLRSRGKFATRDDAERAGKGFCAYVYDQYQVRPKPVTAPVPLEGQRRNAAIQAMKFKLIRIVPKSFGKDRHLVGYRVDVVMADGIRRRMMVRPKEDSVSYSLLSEAPLKEGAVVDEILTGRKLDRGVLFRGPKAKDLVDAVIENYRSGGVALGVQAVYRIAVYKKGPKPLPVGLEVAAEHRAAACARRKRFGSFKAAFAASKNALRRGIKLTPHACEACKGWHVASARNEVTS